MTVIWFSVWPPATELQSGAEAETGASCASLPTAAASRCGRTQSRTRHFRRSHVTIIRLVNVPTESQTICYLVRAEYTGDAVPYEVRFRRQGIQSAVAEKVFRLSALHQCIIPCWMGIVEVGNVKRYDDAREMPFYRMQHEQAVGIIPAYLCIFSEF